MNNGGKPYVIQLLFPSLSSSVSRFAVLAQFRKRVMIGVRHCEGEEEEGGGKGSVNENKHHLRGSIRRRRETGRAAYLVFNGKQIINGKTRPSVYGFTRNAVNLRFM